MKTKWINTRGETVDFKSYESGQKWTYCSSRNETNLIAKCKMVKISCHPGDPLVDEVVHIRIQELSAEAPYTIRSSLCESKTNFSACGCYVADDNGVIDVSTSSCSGGTYSGIEPMGLFWSMKQEPGYKRHIRLIKLNISEPLRVKLCVYEGLHSWETVCKNQLEPVTSTTINRWYKSKDVKRIHVKTGQLRGSLFIPPGEGPFPGIIDLFGGVGGLMEFRAALLASRGFVTYALPYFKFESLDFDPNKTLLNLDYFLEAVDYLSSQSLVSKVGILGISKGAEFAMLTTRYNSKEAVDYLSSQSLVSKVGILGISKGAEFAMLTTRYNSKEAVDYLSSQNLVSKVGILGISKGAEFAMLATRYNSKVKAAVFINGPPFLTVFDIKYGNTIYKCVNKDIGFDFSRIKGTHECMDLRDVYHNYSTNDIIQLWKTDANILYITGDDDQTTDPNLANALLNQYPKDKRSLIEVKSYPDTGHLIEPPFMPLCRKSYNPQFGVTQLWGGQLPGHARAQEDAWDKIQKFFRKHLDCRTPDIKSRL